MIDIFSYKDFNFPKDFILGSATSGHQIEGNNIHTWSWRSELETAKKDPDYEPSGLACNSYEMWQEDVDIIKTLKHQAFRMTVEWARIEPEEGVFKIEEVEHYIRIFEALKKNGVKIVLTLIHGTVPYWYNLVVPYEDKLRFFERYLNYIIPKISQYVDYWCVFNEFNFSTNPSAFIYKIHYVRLHARAYHIIKQYSSAPISTTHALRQHYAKRQNDPFDLAMQNYYDVIFNEFWFHAIRTGEIIFPYHDAFYDKEIKGTCDYWAVNTYARTMIDTRIANCEYGSSFSFNNLRLVEDEKHDMIREFNPECFIQNFLRIKDKPVMVTENGLCCDDDRFRIVWITEYLRALRECMDMGVEVIGYLYWSLLDNYEWGSYKPKFGLVDVDREHGFKRTIKPSGYFYKEIIENGGFNQEILRKYLKEQPRVVYK